MTDTTGTVQTDTAHRPTHTHSTTPGYTNENHRYRTDRHTTSNYTHAQYYTRVHEREPQVPYGPTHHIDLHTRTVLHLGTRTRTTGTVQTDTPHRRTHTHSTTPGYTNENHRYRTDRHNTSTYTHAHSTTPGYTNENHRYRTDRLTTLTYTHAVLHPGTRTRTTGTVQTDTPHRPTHTHSTTPGYLSLIHI